MDKNLINKILLVAVCLLIALSVYLYFKTPDTQSQDLAKYKEEQYQSKVKHLDSVANLLSKDTLRLYSEVSRLNSKLIQANQELIRIKMGFDKELAEVSDRSTENKRDFFADRHHTNDIAVEGTNLIVGDSTSDGMVKDALKADYYSARSSTLDSIVKTQELARIKEDSIKKAMIKDAAIQAEKLNGALAVKADYSDALANEKLSLKKEKNKGIWYKIGIGVAFVVGFFVGK